MGGMKTQMLHSLPPHFEMQLSCQVWTARVVGRTVADTVLPASSSVPQIEVTDVAVANDSVWITQSNEIIWCQVDIDSCVCSEVYTEFEESLIIYLSGWIARKCGICRKCQVVLTKPDQEHSYVCRPQDLFLNKKRYADTGSVGLVLPSADLFHIVHQIESLFRLKYQEKIAQCNLARSLFEEIYPQCDFGFLFTEHPEHALYLSQKIVQEAQLLLRWPPFESKK